MAHFYFISNGCFIVLQVSDIVVTSELIFLLLLLTDAIADELFECV